MPKVLPSGRLPNRYKARPDDTKLCNTCKVRKLAGEFHKADIQYLGLAVSCKDCERVRIRFRHFRKAYGLSRERYEAISAAQGDVCALCLTPAADLVRNGKATCLTVDHSHVSGDVRGLLCGPCNTRLGILEGAGFEAWVTRARDYLASPPADAVPEVAAT